MTKFPMRLKELRKEKLLSQQSLADQIGISKSSINMYERGDREPSIETLELFADLFNVDMDYLIGKSDFKNKHSWLLQYDGSNLPQLPPNAIPYVPGKKIPIIGVIPAGDPLLATEEIEGYAFADVPDPENYFFLRVRGSSMTPGISCGDLVFVRRQSCADNGQIVVALVNGDEATLKRFRQQGQSVILMPDNPDFTPYMLTADDFTRSYARIIGVVVELRRTI